MGEEKKPLNRRQFLGGSVAASIAAVGAGSNTPGSSDLSDSGRSAGAGKSWKKTVEDHPYNERTHKVMPTRNLGKTGFQVGIYSLGGQATIEIPGKEKESVEIVNRAIDLGINYIDTAASYGRGISQKHIGKVIKHRRNEVFLATKTHNRSYDGSMKLLEESLKSLQTDHLDIWQLHNVKRQDELDKIFAGDGAMKAMLKARDEGMIRYIGITGHYEPLVLADALERFEFDTILMALNAADPHYLSFKNYLLPIANQKGIGIIGMKLATRGRLISEFTPPPLEEQQERMRTAIRGTISMKESLLYNFSQPMSTNIVGVDNVKQLEHNVKVASEFSFLNQEQLASIEKRTLPIVRQALYFRRWDVGA